MGPPPLHFFRMVMKRKAVMEWNRSNPGIKQSSRVEEGVNGNNPDVFDVAASVLMNLGLLSVTASVYQMLRGAQMLLLLYLLYYS